MPHNTNSIIDKATGNIIAPRHRIVSEFTISGHDWMMVEWLDEKGQFNGTLELYRRTPEKKGFQLYKGWDQNQKPRADEIPSGVARRLLKEQTA